MMCPVEVLVEEAPEEVTDLVVVHQEEYPEEVLPVTEVLLEEAVQLNAVGHPFGGTVEEVTEILHTVQVCVAVMAEVLDG
jgi:hypothetical protein